MEKSRFGLMAMALMASMVAFTSCDDEETTPAGDQGSNETFQGTTLQGEYTSDVTLEANKTYSITGGVHIKRGATLTIPEGVTIEAVDDDTPDYILIEQGAKIDAQGTATNPIVMTSELKESGAWGGIHICGYAHTNAQGGTGSSEIGNATYGGNDDNDNSGTLRYVRLEYTGFALDEEHEANGISFYGVGRGTTVEYCQAYKGSDDGFEFFGGAVNVSEMVVTNCSDDSFDWTEGWNGEGTNLLAFQASEESLGYRCDCLIEADNNGNDNNATPVSHPILSNLLLVGNSQDETRGIRLREGTEVEIDGAIVCGKPMAITVETANTENALKNGISKLLNIQSGTELSSKEGIYTNADFVAAGNVVDPTLSYTWAEAVEACDWIEGNWVRE